MLQFVLAIVICLFVTFLFWFIGHVAAKKLNFLEENKLLCELVKIALGASAFLIVINFIGNIIKDFNLGLYTTLFLIVALIAWQFSDCKQICVLLRNLFFKREIVIFIKRNTDKYFWMLIGIINFIYGSIAFTTTKLDRFSLPQGHVFNINQLLAGNYPPKYSFAPNIPQKYHYGSDILGAIVSKFSGVHPEISLDLLLMVFLNLSILLLYALTVKYLNDRPINKYLVPFAAFLAWGPITSLFTTNPGETIPQGFLEKISYLTQTRLNDAALWSGLTLHWYFAPPIGIGIFFFLIAIYLLFRFFEGEQNKKFIVLLGIFLSSFVIIDFSKFVILLVGVLIYLFFLPIPLIDELSPEEESQWKKLLKSFGILLLVIILLGYIHGNSLKFGKDYLSYIVLYNLGTSAVDKQFSPFKSNIILLVLFAIGFYMAYKLQKKWIVFLISFFVGSFVVSYFISVPNAGVGKILMLGNLLGAFTLPLFLDSVRERVYLKEYEISIACMLFFIFISSSALIFWGFGDKENALFKFDSGKIKYSGLQVFSFPRDQEEITFIKYIIKSKNIKNKAIVAEPQNIETFSTNTGLLSLLPSQNISEYPLRKELLNLYNTNYYFSDYLSSFSLNGRFWLSQNLGWLYLTPRIFRHILLPQARKKLLNAYLDKKARLSLSSEKTGDLLNLKELYEIDPQFLSLETEGNFNKLLKQFFNSDEFKNRTANYINQIALCPYLGIYNAMSNDFDGDKVADIAFFDELNKKWFIIYGKNQKETEVDLSTTILKNYNGTDLYIPVAADYDGDQKTDIALWNKTSGDWYISRSSDNQLDPILKWGNYIDNLPLPADIDGDGKTDRATYVFQGNSRWPALLSSDNRYYDRSFPSTLLDVPVYSDLDGDKKADHVIYRPTETRFYVYLSSRDYNNPITTIVGETSSRTVLDDYDGDGKTDLATWTPVSGKWEIIYARDLLSIAKSENSYLVKTIFLGKPADIPMPGDYDGDGKADVAVYHPNSGKLEIVFADGVIKTRDLSKFKDIIPASFIGI